MTLYALLRGIHLSCVGLTFISFTTRGLWMWFSPERLDGPWVRITPHVIDTLLLASATGLAITIRQYPFVNGWLTAKLLALLVYIGLGMIALHRGRTRAVRLAALLGALLVFGYIVMVARAHDPWPWRSATGRIDHVVNDEAACRLHLIWIKDDLRHAALR